MSALPSFVPILISSLLHKSLRSPSSLYLVADGLAAVVLWRWSNSILALWRWAMKPIRLWTTIPGVNYLISQSLIDGGPLGPGCGKAVEAWTGYWLWRFAYPTESSPLTLGPWPSLVTWVIVAILCGLTNGILFLWSHRSQSRGNHVGVNTMVESSRGRTLSHAENASLFAWALVNAICEEVVSRGFFLHEFKRRGGVTFWQANVLQATSFGIWHFHGIPSGWTGVGLTFVYGLVMGFLLEYGGGLLLPIVAHTIADYFIFAVIARQGKFM
ncbi:CAAX protease self-immunity [Fragilaria crotonensis]|nr:CAAX protease self-immunity [Fragilaria crotonensis]